MNLIFEKMRIHNFMSYRDEEFDFSEKRGLTLVCGKNLDILNSKNGTGKSSLYSALLYALFGELQYVIKNANLRNRYVNDKEMWVDLYFFADSKKKYYIRRGLKGNQSFIEFNEVNPKNNETIQNFNRSSISETDSFIQREIIHCDISVFLRTIFLSSDQNYNFFKLTPSAKRDFIEKLFNISIFGEMYSSIHRDLLKLDKEIASKQSKLMVLAKNNDNYKALSDKFIKEHNQKIKNLEDEIADLEKNLSKIINESVKSVDQTAVDSIDNIIKSLQKDKNDNVSKQNENRMAVNKLISAKTKLETLVSSNKKMIDSHGSILSKMCDDCRPILEKFYNVDEMNAQMSDSSKKIEKISKKMSDLEDELAKLVEDNASLDKSINENISKMHEMIDESVKHNETTNKMKYEFDQKKIELNSVNNESNPYDKLYEENLSALNEENNLLETMSSKYNYLEFIENIVSADTLKKFIIKDLVNLLNSKIKYYLSKLGAQFECIFDENMQVEFITAGGNCDYANFSSGEQMRLMIATCFSFKDFMQTRNNFQSNILILDEFIDSGIDSLAINGVVKILRDFTKLNKQSIYVISHRTGDLDNSVFDSIIQIEKQNNISKVKYLNSEK